MTDSMPHNREDYVYVPNNCIYMGNIWNDVLGNTEAVSLRCIVYLTCIYGRLCIGSFEGQFNGLLYVGA